MMLDKRVYYEYIALLKKTLLGYHMPRKSNFLGEIITYDGIMEGTQWRDDAFTMLGMRRLNNIQYCIEEIIDTDVPGDVVECGAWRGGAAILMRAVLRSYRDGACERRRVFVADSFAGVPAPSLPQDDGLTFHKVPFIAVPEHEVRSNFEKFGVSDDRVFFIPGLFSELGNPGIPIEDISVLHIDGDLYESTRDVLSALGWHVAPGGYIIVDDYYNIPQVRLAVNEYREQKSIESPIKQVDWSAVYWRVE